MQKYVVIWIKDLAFWLNYRMKNLDTLWAKRKYLKAFISLTLVSTILSIPYDIVIIALSIFVYMLLKLFGVVA